MVIILTTVPLVAFAAAEEKRDPLDTWGVSSYFGEYELMTLDPLLVEEDLRDGTLTLTMLDATYELRLARADWVQPASFGRLNDDGTVTIDAPLAIAGYEGTLADDAASRALLLVMESGVSGHIQVSDGPVVAFQPVGWLDDAAPRSLVVAFHVHDTILPDGITHTELPAPEGEPTQLPPVTGPDAPLQLGTYGPDRRATVWVDYTYVSQNSNWNSVVSAAWNTMRGSYPSNIGWDFSLVNGLFYYCANAQCDVDWGMTSSDAGTLLGAWGNKVKGWSTVSSYEEAHLFTGKGLTSGGNGILGAAWQPGRYAVSKVPGQVAYNLALTVSHELGHSYNGDHGARGIASPGRASTYSHGHSSTVTVCDFSLLGICLLSHQETRTTNYTHHTLMWPYVVGNSGTNEQFIEERGTNLNYMRNCNVNSWTGGTKDPGFTSGFGSWCTG